MIKIIKNGFYSLYVCLYKFVLVLKLDIRNIKEINKYWILYKNNKNILQKMELNLLKEYIKIYQYIRKYQYNI